MIHIVTVIAIIFIHSYIMKCRFTVRAGSIPHHSQWLHAHQSLLVDVCYCLLVEGEDSGPKIENHETQTKTLQPCPAAHE